MDRVIIAIGVSYFPLESYPVARAHVTYFRAPVNPVSMHLPPTLIFDNEVETVNRQDTETSEVTVSQLIFNGLLLRRYDIQFG